MSFSDFDIYFAGKLVADTDPAAAREQIGKLFKLQGEKLEALFSNKPTRIKKAVDIDTAAKYRDMFRKAGALIDIVPSGTKPKPPAAAKPQVPVADTDNVSKAPPPKTTPAPKPAAQKTIEGKSAPIAAATALHLMEANAGSLEEFAETVVPQVIGDISDIAMGDTYTPLDDTIEPPPANIDMGDLADVEASAASLENYEDAIEPIALPDISDMQIHQTQSASPEEGYLEELIEPEPVDLDIDYLSAETGSLEQYADIEEPMDIPDISELSLDK